MLRKRRVTVCSVPVLALAFVWLLVGNTGATAQTSASALLDALNADVPLDVSPNRDIDQDLLLVTALEHVYASWPREQDKTKFLNALEVHREWATALRGAITAYHLDPALAKLYDDCLHLIDANETYLKNLDLIDQGVLQDAKRRAGDLALEEGINATKDDFKGMSSDDTLTDIGVDILLSVIKQSRQVASQRQAAINNQNRLLADVTRETLDEAREQIRQLTIRYRWNPTEVDLNGFGKPIQDIMAERPHDPFILQSLVKRSWGTMTTPTDNLRLAQEAVVAAKLFPVGYFYYDQYRTGLVAYAAGYAVEAALLSSQGGSYSGAGATSSSSAYALRASRTYLSLNPTDSYGIGHADLARALAFAGRYDEAVNAANAAWNSSASALHNDPDFAYLYAILMSLTNSPDQSADWLQRSFALGWTDIADARQTPDLETLRRERPQRFAALTTVAMRTVLRSAIVSHDVVFYNDSPFDITNFTAQLNVTVNHQSLRPVDITIQRLAAKTSYLARDAVVFFGNTYDRFDVLVNCDQCLVTK